MQQGWSAMAKQVLRSPGRVVRSVMPVPSSTLTLVLTLARLIVSSSARRVGGEKIATVAPVTTTLGQGARQHTVRFAMPFKDTLVTLPRPVCPAVTIRQLSARQLLALRFIGRPSDERVTAAERAISGFVQANGLTLSAPIAVAGYDGPDVPEARQHWEVHQPVG